MNITISTIRALVIITIFGSSLSATRTPPRRTPITNSRSLGFNLKNVIDKKNVKPVLFICAGYALLNGINQNRRAKRIVREVSDELTKVISKALQDYVAK